MASIVLFAVALWSTTDGPGPGSHQLTANELKTLLRGSSIIDADRPYSYCCYPEEFSRHGEYVRHSDNFEAHGTYRFKGNQVCTKAEDMKAEFCRRVERDAKGEYWFSGSRKPGGFKRISINKM